MSYATDLTEAMAKRAKAADLVAFYAWSGMTVKQSMLDDWRAADLEVSRLIQDLT